VAPSPDFPHKEYAVTQHPTPDTRHVGKYRNANPHQITLPAVRRLATEAPLPTPPANQSPRLFDPGSTPRRLFPITSADHHVASTVPVTLHSFPTLEPLRVTHYLSQHLQLPLRRDLLHRAIVFEGDNTRQGTASSKTRWTVHGSHRKIVPQKGTGRARAGWRQSSIRVGGGKAFGPHPRDFGTDMPRKMYDKAWRTALSWRYRRGGLVVCEGGVELPMSPDFWELVEHNLLKGELREGYMRKQAKQLVGTHGWGKEFGRTLFVTAAKREVLFEAMGCAGDEGRALVVADVDVKDLLEEGRVVIEREALDEMLESHQSDLEFKLSMGAVGFPKVGDAGLEPGTN
jgi:large subunit ribosomal protein L4